MCSLPDWVQSERLRNWVQCGDLADAAYIHEDRLYATKGGHDTIADYKDLSVKLTGMGCTLEKTIYTQCPGSSKAFAGFVATGRFHDDDALFISWRGTVLPSEWDVDANFDSVEWIRYTGFAAHKGFVTLYDEDTPDRYTPAKDLFDDNIRRVMENKNIVRVVVTGHSLGGALATLCAYHAAKTFRKEVKVSLVTFSAPRVAGIGFAKEHNRVITDHVRIATDGDLVPVVPLYVGRHPPVEAPSVSTSSHDDDIEEESMGTAMAKALLATLRTLPGHIRGTKTAGYHHAGTGLIVTAAALPIDLRIDWTIGNHHSLKLILYLLHPTEDRLEGLRTDLGIRSVGASMAMATNSGGEKRQKTSHE